MSRAITDVEAMRMFINGGLIRTPYFVVLAIVVSFLMLRLDWRLGLLGMSFMPAVAILSAVVRLRLARIWRTIQEEMAELSTALQENLTGVRVVKSFAAEEFEKAKFSSDSADVKRDMVRVARLQAFNTSFVLGMYLAAMGLILWYGGSRVVNGHITIGELVQFLIYLQILSMPVRWTGMIVNNFARAIAAGHRLFEVMDARSPVREATDAAEMPRVRGHVRFYNVGFSYDGETEVLKGIDIDVRPGQVVALLGAPGSGKSTASNLLPRFYDVTSGRITIDGTDVRDVTLKSLRSNIGIVQQDVFLFATSLRENIAYGREDATMDEIVAAARVAQLQEFIEGLDDGYETVIGERGATLSGGQRQRMSIARAVLLDPPVLILDDSTSSVDASTEDLIRKAMESVMSGRTTFVIAHRLSTVHRADQILVMDKGEIVERGTHRELLQKDGLYRRIYELQLRPQEEVMLEIDVAGSPNLWRGT
jgi:ATP-binding cassette subfamily B protein